MANDKKRPPPERLPEDPFYDTPPQQRAGGRSRVPIGPALVALDGRPLRGAAQNNRSGSHLITIPTLAGNTEEQTFLNIMSTPRDGGEDAEIINVLLDTDLPPELDGTNGLYNSVAFELVAILEWGIGGVPFTAEVDWNSQGTSIAIKASVLKVSARLSAVVGNLQPDVEVRLKVALSYGTPPPAGISCPARRTFNMGGPIAGGNILASGETSEVIQIPQWAAGVTVVDAGTFPAGATWDPDWTIVLSENADLSTVSAYFKSQSRSNIANQVEGQFPIPNKARFAALINNSPTSMTAPKLIFNLAV